MMKKRLIHAVAMLAASCLMSANPVSAEDRGDKPSREKKQANLLEEFGDQGIDANNDGALTQEEISAFFEEHPDLRRSGKHRFGGRSHRGCGERKRHGFRGPGGPPHGMHGMLRMLDKLDPEQVPEGNVLERRPGLDTDGDGNLSAEEWAAHAAQKREKILSRLLERAPEVDTDGNGAISDEELAAFKAAQETKMRERVLSRHPDADASGDGVLSDEEFEAFEAQRQVERQQRILEHHPEADLDKDGTLSDEEMQKFKESRPGWGKGRRKGPHGPRFEKRPEG